MFAVFKSKPVEAMLMRLQAEAASEATTDRTAAIARLKEIDAEQAKLVPTLQSKIDACRADVDKAEAALATAKSRLQAATVDKLRAMYPADHEAEQLRARLETELRPACIDAALERLESLMEGNRRAAVEPEERRQQLALCRWCADAREQLLALQFTDGDTEAASLKIMAGKPV